MFTIEQINAVHEKLGTMKGFLSYVTALKLPGVEKYDSYLSDRHAQYYVESEPVHEKLLIADNSTIQTCYLMWMKSERVGGKRWPPSRPFKY